MKVLAALSAVWVVFGPAAIAGQDVSPRVSADGFVETRDGLSLYYRVLGDAPDTAVVVHGGPGAGMGSILPHLAPFADSITLIFYDQRGGGRSSLPADTTRLAPEWFVADLESVRRFFGLERMKLIAHSFGAILVARYLELHPERVERLVLLGATGPSRKEAAEVARSTAGLDSATASRRQELINLLLSGQAEDPLAACHELESLADSSSNWRGSNCDMPPEAVRYYFHYTARLGPRGFGAWDFTERLKNLSVPVLVVHGSEDEAGAPLQRAWADAFADGRLWMIPEAGRGAIADRPDLVRAGILEFLRGVAHRSEGQGEMTSQNIADEIAGKTIRWTWTEGPVAGTTHEHEFNEDGTVVWRVVEGPQAGHSATEEEYAALEIADGVIAVSYLAASGYTLTVVLNFEDNSMVGFASGADRWHPMKGTFEVIG